MLDHRVRVRRKGQMTLPAEIREELKIEEGDLITIRKQDGNYILEPAENWVEKTAGVFAEYANNGPTEIDRDAIWGEIANERRERLLKQIAEENNDHDSDRQ